MTRRAFAVSLPLVVLGGALGGTARHAVDELVGRAVDLATFPWSTLLINVTGAALLALLPAFAVCRRHPTLPAFLGTGVLGGYTTLSAFSEQTRALVDAGRSGLAATYVVVSLGAGLAGVLAVRGLTTAGDRRTFAAEEGDE